MQAYVTEDLEVKFGQEIRDYGDEKIVVQYVTKGYPGIAFLEKGLNNKYRISDAYYSDKTRDSISYRIDDKTYKVIFDESEGLVSFVMDETQVVNKNIFYKGSGPKILIDAFAIIIALSGYIASYPLKKWKFPGNNNQNAKPRQGWIHWL